MSALLLPATAVVGVLPATAVWGIATLLLVDRLRYRSLKARKTHVSWYSPSTCIAMEHRSFVALGAAVLRLFS